MKKHILTILLLTWCAVVSLMAQPLTLDSCLRLAENNNADLQRAQLAVDQAKATCSQARTKFFPQINLVGLGYHALNPLVDVGINDLPSSTVRDVLNVLYSNFGEALGLSNSISMMRHGVLANVMVAQPVYMGGKIVAGNRLADLGVEASQLQADIQHRDLLLTVEENYWLLVDLNEKKQTINLVSELLDTASLMVSAAVKAGLAMPNDLLQVQIRQDELAAQSLQLNNGIRLASQALCQMIGVDYSEQDFVLSDNPSAQLDSLSLINYANPMQQTPESQLLSIQVKAEQLKRRMTLADALPQVVLGGFYGYNNFLAPFDQSGASQFASSSASRYFNGALAVTVKVPLTDWWEMNYKLKGHDAAIRDAELQQQDLNTKLLLRQQQADNRVEETKTLLHQYRHSEQMAKENLRLSALSYQAGMQTISDWLQAQALYMQTLNNLTDAKIQYRLARSRSQALSSGR